MTYVEARIRHSCDVRQFAALVSVALARICRVA